MAILPQAQLFSWKEIDDLGDLERLRLVLEYLPDEELMRHLEEERGRGRDDYPVRAVWNSILAGVVFEHASIESLRRELLRNAQLRELCGFDPAGKAAAVVPPAWVYTRFLKRLMRHAEVVEALFEALVEELRQVLDSFGRRPAVDGKGIATHARARRGDEEGGKRDGRRDVDADWGVKTYRGDTGGKPWEKVKSWFGYKLHLVVEAEHELPVAFAVTRASAAEGPRARRLVEGLAARHPKLVERCEVLTADKGYDGGEFITELWDEHRIKAVVGIRDLWKDGEETKQVSGAWNVVHDYRGTVYCHCPRTDERREMAYGGFEASRETLKYRCPAAHYGVACRGVERCPVSGAVRIKLAEDRRVFTSLARSSYAWKREYRRRTAVERVNSRLDVSFGFERHFIRGLAKMRLRCGLALVVMLSMALGRVKEKQEEKLRSLVRAA